MGLQSHYLFHGLSASSLQSNRRKSCHCLGQNEKLSSDSWMCWVFCCFFLFFFKLHAGKKKTLCEWKEGRKEGEEPRWGHAWAGSKRDSGEGLGCAYGSPPANPQPVMGVRGLGCQWIPGVRWEAKMALSSTGCSTVVVLKGFLFPGQTRVLGTFKLPSIGSQDGWGWKRPYSPPSPKPFCGLSAHHHTMLPHPAWAWVPPGLGHPWCSRQLEPHSYFYDTGLQESFLLPYRTDPHSSSIEPYRTSMKTSN